MSLRAILIYTLLIQGTLATLRQIFPRYSVAKGDFDEESLANLYDRGAVVNEAKLNASCNDVGCNAEFSHAFNFNAARASGVKLTLTGNGLSNTTVVLAVADAVHTVNLEYQYTIYPAYSFVGWASKNYEEDNFGQCLNNFNWWDMINARFESLQSYTSLMRKYQLVASAAARIDYTFWGQTATKVCNHHWATDFVLCQRRALVADYSQGVAVFIVAPETQLTMTMNLAINDDIENVEVRPSVDIPFETNIAGLTLQISPAGTIISPLAGKYYLAHFQRDDMFSAIKILDWYKANTMPTISSTENTATKYHSPQLFPPQANEPTSGKFLPFYYDPNDMSFTNVVACGSNYATESKSVNSRKLQRLRSISSSEISKDRTYLDSFINYLGTYSNPHPLQATTNFPDPYSDYNATSQSRRDGDCCVPIITASRSYLTTLFKSYHTVSTVDGQYELDLPTTLTQSPGSVFPEPVNIKAHSLLKTSLYGVLSTTTLRIPYGVADGAVSSAKVPQMQIATSSTGSYFNYVIDYVGSANLVPVLSKDLYILKRTISVTGSGQYKGSVSFQSPTNMDVSFTICFGINNVCVKPETVNYLNPPQGAIQDPDTTDCAGVAPSFFSIIMANTGLLVVSIFMIIINVVLGLTILVVMVKLMPRLFTLGLLFYSSKQATSLSYTGSLITNTSYIPRDSYGALVMQYTTRSNGSITFSVPSPSRIDPSDSNFNYYLTSQTALLAICHSFSTRQTGSYPAADDELTRITTPDAFFYKVFPVDGLFVHRQITLPVYLPSSNVGDDLSFRTSNTGMFLEVSNKTFQHPLLYYNFDSPSFSQYVSIYSQMIVASSNVDSHSCGNSRFTRLYMVVPTARLDDFDIPVAISDVQMLVGKDTYRAIDFISRFPITYEFLGRVISEYYSGNIDANTFICNGPRATLFRATTVLSCNGPCQSRSGKKFISRVMSRSSGVSVGNVNFYTSNAYYTRQGLYQPSLTGPMLITPYISGNCSVGTDSKGSLLLIDYQPTSLSYSSYRVDGNDYIVTTPSEAFYIKPTNNTCVGSTWVSEDNALLTCDNDCCLSTFDNFASFFLMFAGDVIKIPATTQMLPFDQYTVKGSRRNYFCPTSGCFYGTTYDVYMCAYTNYPTATVFLFYLIPILLGFLLFCYLLKYFFKGMIYGFRSLKFLNPNFYAEKILNPTKQVARNAVNSYRRSPKIVFGKDA